MDTRPHSAINMKYDNALSYNTLGWHPAPSTARGLPLQSPGYQVDNTLDYCPSKQIVSK